MRIPNPAPDPLTRLNPDPIGIQIRNPVMKYGIFSMSMMLSGTTGNEKVEGSGRWQMLGIGLGPW
jgi:hypothetical protein